MYPVAQAFGDHPDGQGRWPRPGRRSGDAFRGDAADHPQGPQRSLRPAAARRASMAARCSRRASRTSATRRGAQIATDEKEAIGRAAARLIPDNASLFINIGTTTEAVARRCSQHNGLMVITNNINVANMMRVYPQIEVVIAGGVVRGSDGGIVGEAAVDFIRQFKVDYAVIGASAIDQDGALLDFDYPRGAGGAGDHRQCAPRHPGVAIRPSSSARPGAHRPSLAGRHLRHRPLRHRRRSADICRRHRVELIETRLRAVERPIPVDVA